MHLIKMLQAFGAIQPEMALGLLICVNLLLACFASHSMQRLAVLASLAVVLALLLWQRPHGPVFLFDHAYVLDPLAFWAKSLVVFVMAMVCWVSGGYHTTHNMPSSSLGVLSLVSILGMMVTVSAQHFLVLFMGLELMALPVYAMVALGPDRGQSTEAAIKYFVMGALATGVFLYGVSLMYGGTGGHLQFAVVAKMITPDASWLVVYGMVLLVVAVGFKLGAAPFHMWVPDVYAGAPHPLVLFIATGPKMVAMVVLLRLLAEVMPVLVAQWQLLMIIMAVASMVLGNFVAIMQTRIRRLLAYSSVAHMGYMLLGFASGLKAGEAAACFYQVVYVLSALGVFTLVLWLGRGQRAFEAIDDLRGLNDKQPILALIFLLLCFSMAGIPPLVGFWAKLAVLEALVRAHLVWLAALALLCAIVGVFYYIRIIKVIYFEAPADGVERQRLHASEWTVAALPALAVLALGIFPTPLWRLCRTVIGI